MDYARKEALHPCVAHRGCSGKAPENTMAAFRMALELPYVKWIELDVHLSRDGVPVVIHDDTVDRTTNGIGPVSRYSAEELARFDAGSWKNPVFAGEGVPTLDQVLELAAGRCRLNIELKGAASEDGDRLARRAVEALRARGMEKEHTITSFRPDILRAVRRYSAELKIGLIIDERPGDLLETLRKLDCSVLSIGFRHVDEKLLRQMSEASIEVMAWTVNSASDLRRLGNRPEPFQLCTNYPERWFEALGGKGKA
ncbi:glycerophosphodiester phosphodiesterase [Paenibacillaceae bacterium WGS1546]|uniref:glycerophosphodiester phosphodiesterase n=1 Tax=Cohnella sp. WGS1546 TaxID=3366810 RepID=UPI00372D4635